MSVEIDVRGCVDCPFWTGDDFGSGCSAPEGPEGTYDSAPREPLDGCPLPVLVSLKEPRP